MTDARFEAILDQRLRDYAEGGVRPIDRYAIASAVIASKRRTRFNWLAGVGPARQRWFVPALVALLILALLASFAIVGALLLRRADFPPRIYQDVLVPAPDLSVEMTHPVVVPLRDGRVLVIGTGSEGFGTPTTVLVYNPATGTSVVVAQFPVASYSVTSAVRLLDGRVLIGGSSPRIFDPETLQFVQVGPMIGLREDPDMALLQDGRVLIAGGHLPSGDWLRSAELFDPETLTFSATGSVTSDLGRSFGDIVTMPDGQVFYGRAQVEIYDPETGSFSSGGSMPDFDLRVAIVAPDGRVVGLGNSHLTSVSHAAAWDPASQTWSPLIKEAGFIGGATLLDDGRILLIGSSPSNTWTWTGIYDPTARKLELTTPSTAWWPSLARLNDGRVVFVGGVIDGQIRSYGGGVLAPAMPTVEIFQ
jgi:hypothetical protein